jgi:hypothetical protein
MVLASFPTPLQPVAPAGGLIYDGSVNGSLTAPAKTDTYTLQLDPNQTLTLVAHPSAPGLRPTVTLTAPNNKVLGVVTAPAAGADAVLQAFPIVKAGSYTFSVSGAASTQGPYTLQAILNAGVESEDHGGPADDTLGSAQVLDASSVPVGGANDRLAVLGTIAGGPVVGDVYVAAQTGFNLLSDGLVYRIDQATGKIDQAIHSPEFVKGLVEGVKLGPDNTLYVGLTFLFNSVLNNSPPPPTVSGELVHLDLQGNTLGTIPLPDDPSNQGLPYPNGFDVAADGSFWLAQSNSGNVVHVAPDGKLLKSFPVSSSPALVALAPTGHVIVGDVGFSKPGLYDLDLGTGNVAFLTTPVRAPGGLNFTPGGDLWVSDQANSFLDRLDNNFKLKQQIAFTGVPGDVQADRNGNVWTTQGFPLLSSATRFGPSGDQQYQTAVVGSPQFLSVLGGEFANIPPLPAPDLVDTYSFGLAAGQSATVVVTGLNGHVQMQLEDASGKVLAQSKAGGEFDGSIRDFVAKQQGRYYLVVTGDQSTQYSLVVTRGADFGNKPSVNKPAAQDITSGALGAIHGHSPAKIITSYDGIDSNSSSCGCLPPDTVAAVGGQFVVEAVNVQLRVTDKAGNVKLDEPFTDFFAPLGVDQTTFTTDPYVEYDDIARRWYVSLLAFPPDFSSGAFLFAVSKDANPLHGFSEHSFQVGAFDGSGLDFDKMGYNADAVFLTANDFATPNITPVVLAIDKASILGATPTFVSYVSTPPVDSIGTFAPAQMHGATAGMPEYFVTEAGAGNGQKVRVVTLTNFLSNSPHYVLTDLAVNPYAFPPTGDQPTAPGTVQTNDTDFTQADWRNGKLVAADTVSEPDDNYATARVRWYQFGTTGSAPTLIQQGTVHPGPGVSTFFGSIVQDAAGNLGMTYMESSATEYVSMYVATKLAGTPLGVMGNGLVAAAGQGLMPLSLREGDYSSIAVDPTDGVTFWAANEYVGTDAVTENDFWRTHLAAFRASTDPGANYYAVNLSGGDLVQITVTVPGAGPGQFVNEFVPAVYLYDPNGKLVDWDEAQRNDPSGREVAIVFHVPRRAGGRYTIKVAPSSSTRNPTQGEYVLEISGGGSPFDRVLAQTISETTPGGSTKPVASSLPFPNGTTSGFDGRLAISNFGLWSQTGSVSIVSLDVSQAANAAVAQVRAEPTAAVPATRSGPEHLNRTENDSFAYGSAVLLDRTAFAASKGASGNALDQVFADLEDAF